MMPFIRSLFFSLIMILSTILIASSLVLLSPLPYRWIISFARIYPAINLLALKYICGINYKISGRENIPDQTCIIFSKHQSTWETLALQIIFPPMAFVIKRELLWVPFFGWGLAAMRPVAINRSSGRNAITQMVKKGTARLKQGVWMTKSGYPVVPVAHNAGEFWPRGQFLKKPGTIQVVIGPQIPSNNRKPENILADAENWIESTMGKISRPA